MVESCVHDLSQELLASVSIGDVAEHDLGQVGTRDPSCRPPKSRGFPCNKHPKKVQPACNS